MPFADRGFQRTVGRDCLPPRALADDMQSGYFAPCEVSSNCTSQGAKCQATLAGSQAKSFANYGGDVMLHSAVERQVEIVGEALAQSARIDGETVSRISDHSRFIAFRNIFIHGYSEG